MENPFCDPDHTPWLPRGDIIQVASRLADKAGMYPWLPAVIPWLADRSLSRLFTGALEHNLWPHRRPGRTVATQIWEWFRPITRPLADAAHALFTGSLPRTVDIVDAIFRRWARTAGKRPIPCSRLLALGLLSPYHGGSLPLETDRTWRIDIRPVDCRLPGRTGRPWLIRVCDTPNTLLFRLLPHRPSAAQVTEMIYEALTTNGNTVILPQQLVVPAPIPQRVATFAQSHRIAVTETGERTSSLRLRSRHCASITHLARLVDQFCEQEGGITPLHEAITHRKLYGNELWISSLYPSILTQATDLLPRYPVRVSPAGTIHWSGQEYHDGQEHLLPWFADEVVHIRPFPDMDTVLLAEWCGEALALVMAKGSSAGRTSQLGNDLLLRRWSTIPTHLGGWPEGAANLRSTARSAMMRERGVTVKPTKRTSKVLRMTQKVTNAEDNESHNIDSES